MSNSVSISIAHQHRDRDIRRASAGSSPARRRCSPKRSTRWPTSATRCCSRSARSAVAADPIVSIRSAAVRRNIFWALVSAVSVFFIGCGINLYHGVHALLAIRGRSRHSPLLVFGLLLFALALESWTLDRCDEGDRRLAAAFARTVTTRRCSPCSWRTRVALIGIVLTLLVAGVRAISSDRIRRSTPARRDRRGRHPRRDGALPRRDQPARC